MQRRPRVFAGVPPDVFGRRWIGAYNPYPTSVPLRLWAAGSRSTCLRAPPPHPAPPPPIPGWRGCGQPADRPSPAAVGYAWKRSLRRPRHARGPRVWAGKWLAAAGGRGAGSWPEFHVRSRKDVRQGTSFISGTCGIIGKETHSRIRTIKQTNKQI